MNRKLLLPIVVLVLVTLACAAPTSDSKPTPTLPPAPTVEVATQAPEPTATQIPTEAPAPTEEPTDEPVATEAAPDLPTAEPQPDEPAAFYVEEFAGDLSQYTYFLNYGDENGFELYPDNDKLNFEIDSADTALYVVYDPYYYDDVYVEVAIENRGANTMDVSLLCRYNDDGWYEFAIQSNGLWYIYRYDAVGDGKYTTLYNGGSKDINTGKAENIYGATCQGNDLTFYINGNKAFSVKDRNHREGQVGFGVTSYSDVPVKVEYEYFAILEP